MNGAQPSDKMESRPTQGWESMIPPPPSPYNGQPYSSPPPPMMSPPMQSPGLPHKHVSLPSPGAPGMPQQSSSFPPPHPSYSSTQLVGQRPHYGQDMLRSYGGIKREMHVDGEKTHTSPPRPDSTMGPNYSDGPPGGLRNGPSPDCGHGSREKHGKRGKGKGSFEGDFMHHA